MLAIGTRFAETDASSWNPAYTWRFPPSRLIQIDIDPAEIGRNYPVEIGVVADAAQAVPAIADAVAGATAGPGPTGRAARRDPRAARPALFAGSAERGRSDQFPLRPERILADVRDALPPTRSSSPTSGGTRTAWPSATRCRPRGGSSPRAARPRWASARPRRSGCSSPTPDRVVVALIGDGGMSAQLPAVPMAVERGLPVIFLVMNNRAHGTIADLQAANFGRSYGCEFTRPRRQPVQPDFAAFGRACGADGYDIAQPADLAAALRTAIQRRRPAVLDVPMVNEPVPTPGHWNIKDIYQGVFD